MAACNAEATMSVSCLRSIPAHCVPRARPTGGRTKCLRTAQYGDVAKMFGGHTITTPTTVMVVMATMTVMMVMMVMVVMTVMGLLPS